MLTAVQHCITEGIKKKLSHILLYQKHQAIVSKIARVTCDLGTLKH